MLDDVFGVYRIRQFTLRAIGEHVEIWVQSHAPDAQGVSGTSFLPGDCRNNRTDDHRPAARVDGARVRHEHVPEGVGRIQRAADA